MTCVLRPGRCTLVELFIDGNVLQLKVYIPVFEQGPDLSNRCSSSSEVAVSCFGEVTSKDLLGEREWGEKWALTFCVFLPLKYGFCCRLLSIWR